MSETMKGYILIADISGYTMFLSESELEHAQAVLQSLLEIMIKNTRLPLIISRLEGDAVISYAPQGSILQGQSMLEMVEGCYVAFKRALELMVINTTCTCNACKNMHMLDLKFFLHYGTFGLQPLTNYTELIGTDVNLIHRLTKNHVFELTGWKAYTLITKAAVEALGLGIHDMQSLSEHYEHLGEVEIFVQDMAPVWEREREHNRIVVQPEDATLILEFEFPVTQVHLWDYVSKPEYFAIMVGADRADSENTHGSRMGAGSVYTCAHGNNLHSMTVIDWQPFETLTLGDRVFDRVPLYSTYRLEPAGESSRLTILFGRAQTKNPLMRFMIEMVTKTFLGRMKTGWAEKLRQRMEQDLADGTRTPVEAVKLDLEAIRKSIQAELAKD